ncbi:MAG: hypothetical protein Kow00108_04710 [Calditrichia bacterium]
MKRIQISFIISLLFLSILLGQNRRIIGIVPFGNKNNNARYQWLSRGIEEILYDKLKSVSGFLVYEKETLDRYLDKYGIKDGLQVEAREAYKIGKVSGIEVLITGDYTIENESSMSIHIKFINTYTGSRMFEETYNAPLDQLFNIFNIAVDELLKIVQTELTPEEQAKIKQPITKSIKAFEYYCQAYQELEKPGTRMEVVAGLFSRAIREDADFWEAQYNMGVIYYMYKFYDRAVRQFNKVIQKNPSFYKPYYGRGIIYYVQKKYKEAIRDFERVLQLKKDDDRSLYYLGTIYNRMNQPDKAMDYIRKSIEINPDFAPAHYQLGVSFKKQKKYKSGIKVLRQAVGLDPNLAEAHNALGECYYRINMFDEALNEFNTAIQLRPDFANAYFNKANTIYKKNSLEDIVTAYMELLEVFTDEEKTNPSGSAKDLEERNNSKPISAKAQQVYNEMIAAYRAAIQNDPKFYEACFNLALTYDNIGNVDSAYFFYRISLDINPLLARAHLKIAKIYEGQGDYESALQEYKEVVKADPTFFTISPKLGEKYRYINVVEATIKELQQQLKDNPNDVKALKSMGRIFYHLGKYSQARQMFEQVLKVRRADSEASWYLNQMKKI